MTKNRRKLIFLWTYLEWGGAQVYFMAIMKEVQPHWDVITILPRNSSPEIIRYLGQIGVKYEYLDFCLDTAGAHTIWGKIQRQWSRIRSEVESYRFLTRYDLSESILHLETAPWQSWILLILLSLKKANVFVTFHNAPGTSARWRRLIWKARMQIVSRLPRFHIFTSNYDTKNKIRHLVKPSFWDDIAVTYTCVDPRQIDKVITKANDRTALRKQFGFKKDDFLVLCVGQFIDRKGRWVYLESAKLMKSDRAIFVWLGPKALGEEETHRIQEYELGSNFRFMLSSDIGPTREKILEFFLIADVFALPSFVEGLPIALLEAMALGLPCISTNVYAIPEAIKHGETGLLVDSGDAVALAREIKRLRNDPSLRQKLSKDGQEYVLSHFDERVASQIAISKYTECFDDVG
jgi:glycosyltransferase involved in cell wall biosynthesis